MQGESDDVIQRKHKQLILAVGLKKAFMKSVRFHLNLKGLVCFDKNMEVSSLQAEVKATANEKSLKIHVIYIYGKQRVIREAIKTIAHTFPMLPEGLSLSHCFFSIYEVETFPHVLFNIQQPCKIRMSPITFGVKFHFFRLSHKVQDLDPFHQFGLISNL